jgi:hypothetical protein
VCHVGIMRVEVNVVLRGFKCFRPLSAMGLGLLLAGAVHGERWDVGAVPEKLVSEWKLDPFYQKHVDVGGFPVVGSAKVQDAALKEAAHLIARMLEGRDDIIQALASNQVRFVVMAANEFTTDIPEHRTLEPARFWDKRARGLGATRRRPAVSCGEENLLGFQGDPYFEENILIHEFAHAIHGMGLSTVDPTFDGRLREAYEAAMASGLWSGTYAAVNHSEYWAEGVQSWFDCNRENDAQHNHVSTRERIREYDVSLSALLLEVFGDRPWRYKRPPDRDAAGRAHMDGYNPAMAPRFSWPEDLLEWNRQHALRVTLPEAALRELPMQQPNPDPISRPVSTLRDSSILFMNRRSGPITLYQLDPMGRRKKEGDVPGNTTRRVATYAGQTWLLMDGSDTPIGTVVASFEPGKVTLE